MAMWAEAAAAGAAAAGGGAKMARMLASTGNADFAHWLLAAPQPT